MYSACSVLSQARGLCFSLVVVYPACIFLSRLQFFIQARGCLTRLQFFIPLVVVCPACSRLSRWWLFIPLVLVYPAYSRLSGLCSFIALVVVYPACCGNLRFPPTMNYVRLLNTELLLLLLVLNMLISAIMKFNQVHETQNIK